MSENRPGYSGVHLERLAPSDTADLFVALCERLRAMNATRVDAFGMSCSFAGAQPAEPREPARKPDPLAGASDEEREVMKRAQQLLRGDR